MDSPEFFVHGRRTQAAKQLDDPSLLSTDHFFFRLNLRSPLKSEDSPQKQRIKRPLCTARRTQAAKQLDDPSLLSTDHFFLTIQTPSSLTSHHYSCQAA